MCHADAGIPLKIGNGVTVGHQCCLHGCTIEDDCLIGMGATVMNQAVIGTGSVIAAGAVVLEKTIIPPYSLVIGSPGKVKKTYENKEEIKQMMQLSSNHYAGNARTLPTKISFMKSKR
ncbi:MAG: gamma carbonic anhydrase family protein [Desulfobacterales bacterium]